MKERREDAIEADPKSGCGAIASRRPILGSLLKVTDQHSGQNRNCVLGLQRRTNAPTDTVGAMLFAYGRTQLHALEEKHEEGTADLPHAVERYSVFA